MLLLHLIQGHSLELEFLILLIFNCKSLCMRSSWMQNLAIVMTFLNTNFNFCRCFESKHNTTLFRKTKNLRILKNTSKKFNFHLCISNRLQRHNERSDPESLRLVPCSKFHQHSDGLIHFC